MRPEYGDFYSNRGRQDYKMRRRRADRGKNGDRAEADHDIWQAIPVRQRHRQATRCSTIPVRMTLSPPGPKQLPGATARARSRRGSGRRPVPPGMPRPRLVEVARRPSVPGPWSPSPARRRVRCRQWSRAARNRVSMSTGERGPGPGRGRSVNSWPCSRWRWSYAITRAAAACWNEAARKTWGLRRSPTPGACWRSISC